MTRSPSFDSPSSVPPPPALIHSDELPRYDWNRSYQWNYDHAPDPPTGLSIPAMGANWTYCGRPVASPLGAAAGPLLNGKWILYYAALGFDILTYKTVRSSKRACYPLPNLQPVETDGLRGAGERLRASPEMIGSWAVSFGMPSMEPSVWRADVEWTRRRLPSEKQLAVSVVASAQPGWTEEELAADFTRCARWAVDSGADCIETNFSCPNVSTVDGQLYQQPELAARVAQQVREAIGDTPLVIKIGFVADDPAAHALVAALAPFANALAMTNCISATVAAPTGDPLFDNQPRGIGGSAIRSASVEQVRRFAAAATQQNVGLKMIGVGGISRAEHVKEYLQAGAEAVQVATALMTDPLVAFRIRHGWNEP